jgi:hypothetical protein
VPQQVGQSAVATPYGVGIRTSADVAPFGFTLALPVDPGNCGVVFVGTPDDMVQGANSGFSWAYSDSSYVHMNGSLSVKGFAVQPTAITGFFFDPVAPERVPKLGAYVGCYSNDQGAVIYVDGVGVNSGTHSASSTTPLVSMWVGSRPNALIRCWRGVSEMAATLRVCDPGMGKELSSNPWQLFRPDPIRIYSFPSGAITLNSLTMSNFTSSGARAILSVTR